MNPLKRNKDKDADSSRSNRTEQIKNAPVFSYYSNRSIDRSERIPRQAAAESVRLHHTSIWIRYLPSFVSLAVVIVSVLYLTTLSNIPKIVIATTNDKPLLLQDVGTYQIAASQMLNSSLTSKSKLTINTDKIARSLEEKYPELGDVSVAIPMLGRQPIVQVSSTKAQVVMISSTGSYILDNRGIAVLPANQVMSSVRDALPVVTDNSQTTVEVGKQVLPKDLISFIIGLDGQFNARNINIESYVLPPLTNELHVRLTGKGYIVKFNSEADARQQAGTYFAVQELLDSEGKEPAEYIDVRVDERAYYK